jgi:hypothetical protein
MSDTLLATVAAIIASLDTAPDEWAWSNPDSKIVLRHIRGVGIWVSYSSRIHVYEPNEVKFGFWQGIRLRRAYNRWKKRVGNDRARSLETKTCQFVLATLARTGDA